MRQVSRPHERPMSQARRWPACARIKSNRSCDRPAEKPSVRLAERQLNGGAATPWRDARASFISALSPALNKQLRTRVRWLIKQALSRSRSAHSERVSTGAPGQRYSPGAPVISGVTDLRHRTVSALEGELLRVPLACERLPGPGVGRRHTTDLRSRVPELCIGYQRHLDCLFHNPSRNLLEIT